MAGVEEAKKRITELLARLGVAEWRTIRESLGDVRKIDARLALADLVRGGVVERVPDYEARRMVFKLARGRGGEGEQHRAEGAGGSEEGS